MKKIIDTPLKILFPILMGIATMIIITLSSVIVIRILKHRAMNDAAESAQLIAENAGNRVAGVINNTGNIVRTYSEFLKQTVTSDIIPDDKKREQLYSQMKLLVEEGKINSIWCTMEPDVIDGSDSLFYNTMGSNSKGHFSVLIANENGKISSVTSEDGYDAIYYKQPKTTLREYISEPFWDDFYEQATYIFSFCFPLVVDGQFIGVLGTDLRVNEINNLVRTMDETVAASGRLISDEGIVVSDPDVSHIGKLAENGNNEILAHLKSGQLLEGMYNVNGQEVYKAFIPVSIGNEHWHFSVDTPKSVIYSEANKLRLYMILFNAASVMLVFLIVFTMSRSLIRWIEGLTKLIHQMSFGRLDIAFDRRLGDNEIGKMSHELEIMTKGLQRTANFAKEIGEGNLNAEFEPLSGDDVLGNSLIEMRNNMQKVKEDEDKYRLEEEHRNWGTTGLAKFAEILRQDNDDLETLSYHIISNLVKYMEVNQGGIFILNDDDSSNIHLELKACYAYDRRKYAEKHILPGEGLVGTSFVEGEPIYMTDIPNDYINIESGLGGNNPKALLITPLKVNNEIYGIIELASFTPFEPYQLEFVEKLGESIAATVSTVKVNVRTNRLLEQTKLQAEEMANQEEELRQNMEEMQATQEEMRRREIEMTDTLEKMQGLQNESKTKELEFNQLFQSISNSFHVIEFSEDGFLTNVNDNVLKAHNLPKDAFVGKPLSDFVRESPQEMTKMMQNLQQGIPQTKQQEVSANGKTTLFQHEFIPFTDAMGKVYKILLIAYAI